VSALTAVRARFRRGGLTARLALGSCLTLVFAIGTIGWHSAQRQAEHARTAAERQTLAHVTGIAAAGRQPVLLADLAQLEDILLQTWQPIESGSVIGWVWLRYDLAEMAAHRREVLTDTARFVLAVLAISLVLLAVFLERPLATLRRATDFARSLTARGGGQLPEEPDTPLEVSDLVRALNQTSIALRYQHNRAETSARALREREGYLAELVRQAPDGFLMLDLEGRIVTVNPAAETLAGLGASAMVGRHFADLGILAPASRSAVLELFPRVLNGEELPPAELEVLRPTGERLAVEVRLQLSRVEQPPVFVAIVQDITQRKNTETRLQYLANFDTLTGLPNRILLGERLDQAIREADRHQRLVAVMFVDLDNFKIVNDSLGHEAGDVLLSHVARELQASVRPGDTVARLGGDEFVVVLANVAHIDDIARVAHKMLDTLAQPVAIAGREIVTTPSIGITVYPFDEQSGEGLLKNADAAMYHAKERGRNNFQFFTADLNSRVQRRLALDQALRHALERGELSLHYQPQADLISGRVIGLEALARWRHPEWGMVSPLEFIPVAEETGLIGPIGEWVLREACATAARLRAEGHAGLKIAVNLSARQFDDPRLPELVARILAETGLPPPALDLEVTESLLMRNVDDAVRTLDTLAAQGTTISLDDFGTGYSSLSYLKRLPIDALKVDRAFVRDVTRSADDAAIVRAVIALAHALGIQVIAEGVEDEAQLGFLRRHGCDALQGYLFAKPMDAEALQQWLGADRPLPAFVAPEALSADLSGTRRAAR
jgi:diguanylate cyclase (GGDEF)-like protein/PAS domain S-box-containing protein